LRSRPQPWRRSCAGQLQADSLVDLDLLGVGTLGVRRLDLDADIGRDRIDLGHVDLDRLRRPHRGLGVRGHGSDLGRTFRIRGNRNQRVDHHDRERRIVRAGEGHRERTAEANVHGDHPVGVIGFHPDGDVFARAYFVSKVGRDDVHLRRNQVFSATVDEPVAVTRGEQRRGADREHEGKPRPRALAVKPEAFGHPILP
jgi:hypothetical protein